MQGFEGLGDRLFNSLKNFFSSFVSLFNSSTETPILDFLQRHWMAVALWIVVLATCIDLLLWLGRYKPLPRAVRFFQATFSSASGAPALHMQPPSEPVSAEVDPPSQDTARFRLTPKDMPRRPNQVDILTPAMLGTTPLRRLRDGAAALWQSFFAPRRNTPPIAEQPSSAGIADRLLLSTAKRPAQPEPQTQPVPPETLKAIDQMLSQVRAQADVPEDPLPPP